MSCLEEGRRKKEEGRRQKEGRREEKVKRDKVFFITDYIILRGCLRSPICYITRPRASPKIGGLEQAN
ncbi:MAG: hypothetical protein F6K48_22525 [Okeania sp. SIO3H1]|uniref:hypothetical protein n=1 Tax=Okeania sp. SIO1I7 TaxID=2607772 RepID=UPI0013CDD6E6|nr:hypothetical protein [Okeania sp. SIO1I7]NEN91525.1 hypothetical protein [Okeania sp. SIO3H1]NET28139.1 hypothetical protein [Okeania sp. SIO1I7]